MTGVAIRAALVLILAGGLDNSAAAQPSPARATGDPTVGRDLYVKVGCYECHGYSGQGGETGPQLAPGLLPLAAFRVIVRSPPAVMPAYSEAVLSDVELTNIHAYLSALPKPRSSREIPILRSLPGPHADPGGAR